MANVSVVPQHAALPRRRSADLSPSGSGDSSALADILPEARDVAGDVNEQRRMSGVGIRDMTRRSSQARVGKDNIEFVEVCPPKVTALDPEDTARALMRDEPSLLEFLLKEPPEVEGEAYTVTTDREEPPSPETLWRCGFDGHTSKRFGVQADSSAFNLTVEDLRSNANDVGASTDLAALKIASAARYIESFPKFDDEEIFLSGKEKKFMAKADRIDTAEERLQQFKTGMREVVPRDPQKNRLHDSLSEATIREACNVMYNWKSGVGCEEQDFVLGSIEGALMAWDLTSEIQGAWRVPLTIVTECANITFAYVCIIIYMGSHVAALGRCSVEELSCIPLARQKVSDVVRKYAENFVTRGHGLKTIYLGLPAECPPPCCEAASFPLIWRYLKLSCVRQEWMSLLATCDLYVAQRRAIRRSALFSTGVAALPRGFANLHTRKATRRLKASAPTLTRKQRPRRRQPLPELGCTSFESPLSDIGVWRATPEELRCTLYGDLHLPGAGDLEDCSSASSNSLDDFEEDRALLHIEPLMTSALSTTCSLTDPLAQKGSEPQPVLPSAARRRSAK